jgi:hypothetical protein
MRAVHHKQHSTKYNYLQTFQKNLIKIQSTVWSHLMCTDREMEIIKVNSNFWTSVISSNTGHTETYSSPQLPPLFSEMALVQGSLPLLRRRLPQPWYSWTDLHHLMMGTSHHTDVVHLSLNLYSSVKHHIFINHDGTTPLHEKRYTLLAMAFFHYI